MKGLILVNGYTRSEHELNQPRRIRAELAARGVQCQILRNDGTLAFLAEGARSQLADAAFAVYLDKDSYASHLLEKTGLRLFNRADAVEVCDDKMRTHIALAGAVPMPRTLAAPLCYTDGEPVPEHLLDEAERLLGYPVVVKECFGSLGKGVHLARDRAQLRALLTRLQKVPHLLQQFAAERAGEDVRVIVVGGRAVGAMRRIAQGDFRSNAELGGRAESVSPDGEAVRIAERAAALLGLDYCGVDLLPTADGYLLCEVNSNAFFGTFERVTGINVAARYAEHIIAAMSAR